MTIADTMHALSSFRPSVFFLYSDEPDFAWFNVLNSFSYPLDFESGFGPFLIWLSLFTLAIYFVTSSDSGSLIVDNLASNGFEALWQTCIGSHDYKKKDNYTVNKVNKITTKDITLLSATGPPPSPPQQVVLYEEHF